MEKFTYSTNSNKSLIPLYVLIKSIIRNKILNGYWDSGDKLPNEETLATQFKVSRVTIRTALSQLESEGFLIRNRAKGTFVTESLPLSRKFMITNEPNNIFLLVNAGQFRIDNVAIHDMQISDTRNPKVLREFFGLRNDDPITNIRRIALRDGNPLLLLETFVLPELGKLITPTDLYDRGISDVLKRKINLSIGKNEMYIEATPAEPDLAETLKTQLFEPLIFQKLNYYSTSGDPIELAFCFMRPDYFAYRFDIKLA